MKITLDNGRTVEISQESYEALANAVQEKKWKPEDGEKCWGVTSGGNVDLFEWKDDDEYDKFRLASGNCFPTKEKAEMHKKRLLAREGRFLPKERDPYWTINSFGRPVERLWSNFGDIVQYEIGAVRRTEKEIIEWKDKFYDAFEDLIK